MKYVEIFEKIVIWLLIVLVSLVILLATLDLAYALIKDIIATPIMILAVNELLEIFGLFLLVLIGLELLETIKTYISERLIRVEIVFMVALIAMARKVIILDLQAQPSLTLVGIGAILLALSLSYFLIRRSHREKEVSRPGSKT